MRPCARPHRHRALPALLCFLVFATWADAASPTVPSPASSAPSICTDQQRTGGPPVDFACLRRVYTQPRERWPAPHVDPGVIWQELAPLPRTPPMPADNPPTPERIALGKRLFEDPRLSRSGQIACANCHDPQLGWADGRSVSFGHDRQTGRRNAISVATSALMRTLFWDGRAASLEDQALHPLVDGREMANRSLAPAIRRVRRDPAYRAAFADAYGSDRIDAQLIARSLATFQRSLAPRTGRLDRFLAGRTDQLDDRQLWGLHLFRTKARCMNCHSGPEMTDHAFHNLGLHFHGRRRQDLGRYEVTGDPADAGKFRTPSLRGVARTAPYMHNGLFPHLLGVVRAYDAGMPAPRPTAAQRDDPTFPRPDPLLRPLGLQREEIEAIVDFLEQL